MDNKIDHITFPVRNIDTQEWNSFKYYAGKMGRSANEQMLILIDLFNKTHREE